MPIFVLVLFVAVAAAMVASAYGVRLGRLRIVEDELRTLGASPVRSGNTVMGAGAGGMAVTYELRPGGKNAPSRTFCTALIPPQCPRLEMELRPQTVSELRHVERGRAIDLVLGDDVFDDAFIVEAAPSEVARAMLDEPVRAALLTFHPCRLTIAAHELCFDKAGMVAEPGEVRRLLELCVGACVRLAALSTETQTPRRIGHDSLRSLATSSAGEAEIAALRAARQRRRDWQRRQAALAVGVVLVGVVVSARLAGFL